MKTKIISIIKGISLLLGCMFIVYSCSHDEIVDMDYPDSLINIPISAGGIYRIDALNQKITPPIPGATWIYEINKDENKFIIPLSVYRSGLDLGGSANLTLAVRDDLVTEELVDELKDANAEMLPEGKYSFEQSLVMPGGERVAPFNLTFDFKYLHDQSPKVFYVPISVSSENAKVSPNLSTVIVLIDTKMMIPILAGEPDDEGVITKLFAGAVDKDNPGFVAFSNISQYAVSYLWDFGDGSEKSSEAAPTHKYAEPGTYTVTLAATGIYGDVVKETIEIVIK